MIQHRTPYILLATIFLITLSSCDSSAARFAEIAGKSGNIELYEGLPHQRFEKDLLAAELKKGGTVQIDGYPFYREVLSLSSVDAGKLSALLKDKDVYVTNRFAGLKHCGGFHPDYALKFKTNKGVHTALICFGCNEAKLHGPGVDANYDIKKYAEIESILGKYRKNRPKGRLSRN